MKLTYLGKYTTREIEVHLYLQERKQTIVSTLSNGSSTLVQGFKKVLLKSDAEPDYLEVLKTLRSHPVNLELFSTEPSPTRIDKEVPTRGSKTKWLESALARVEEQLDEARDEYEEWRGVRDVDEAREHFHDRGEEIFDLSQKLIALDKKPKFTYQGRYKPSAWQHTDRIRYRELRDQAKARRSAVKQRLNFTYRRRIKKLKDKKKALEKELDEEREKDAARDRKIQQLSASATGLTMLLTVRSRPIFTSGRKRPAVEEALQEVQRQVDGLTKRLEPLGVAIKDADPVFSLSPVFVPDYLTLGATTDELGHDLYQDVEASLNIVDEADYRRGVADALEELLEDGPDDEPDTDDLTVFPRPGNPGEERLAYLGMGLDFGLDRTQLPVFYDLDEQGPRHTAVIGGSGSGKSVAASVIVEGALLYDVPVLVVDPTGSWTGFARPCESNSLLDLYDDFQLRPTWARGFPTKIIELEPDHELEPGDFLDHDGITVLVSRELSAEQESEIVGNLLRKLQQEMRGWRESRDLRAMVVLEEAHRYLQENDIQPVLEVFARTARARGVGLMAVSQVATDLPPAVRNNCATKVQMQTNYRQDLTRAAKVFGSDYRNLIPNLSQGQGAIRFPEYGSALVAFRPPLHSTVSLPQPVARLHTVSRQVEKLMENVLDDTTDDTTTSSTDGRERSEEAEKEEPTWRDVAEEIVDQLGANMSGPELREAIIEAEIEPPSLRTVQRFLRDHREG